MENSIANTKKFYLLMILSLLYLTISLSCDILAFRLISFGNYSFGAAALIYGSLYILLDAITRLTSSQTCIKLIFIFHIFDFIYTYLLYLVGFLPAHTTKMIEAYNLITAPLPGLFWGGIVGSVLAGIIEVVIFSSLQKKIKNFFLASCISTSLIMMAHNIPTDYFALRHVFPNNYWNIIFTNFTINVFSVMIFSTLMTQFINNFRAKL